MIKEAICVVGCVRSLVVMKTKIGYSGGFVGVFCVRNSEWYAYIIK